MSSPLPFQKTTDGRWAVHCDQTPVVVQTRGEAELLASVSVEHAKLYDDTPGEPDRKRVEQIVALAKQYAYTSVALRALERWLGEQRA
jgi:hypothetical protein